MKGIEFFIFWIYPDGYIDWLLAVARGFVTIYIF